MTTPREPDAHPQNPYFSSGPCAKRPGWSVSALGGAVVGRSHRSSAGKARLAQAIDLTKDVLELPADYRCGIVPGSDTGAFEMAMWTMLGARGVDLLTWESFGAGWASDATKQLALDDLRVMEAPYGELPDLDGVDFDRDVVFAANGTTSGVRVPHYDWIAPDRTGLTFVDGTSEVFAHPVDWAKVDVLTFSWQKAMGSEAAHGMLVLSPRAVERLESYTPDRPLPKVFRLTKGGGLIEGIFRGETINTPSMLAVEDYVDALEWATSVGGGAALRERAEHNANVLFDWIAATPWVENLAVEPETRSRTSVCLSIAANATAGLGDDAPRAISKRIVALLADRDVAYDIGAYRDAPPGLRIWCGATVEADDLRALTPWLDWAFATARAEIA